MVNSNIFQIDLETKQTNNKNTTSGPYSEMFCSIVGFTRDFAGPDYAIRGMILVLVGYSVRVKVFIFQV